MYEENMIDKEQIQKQIDKSKWFKQTKPQFSNIKTENIQGVRQINQNKRANMQILSKYSVIIL
jgi:hypothetical protein